MRHGMLLTCLALYVFQACVLIANSFVYTLLFRLETLLKHNFNYILYCAMPYRMGGTYKYSLLNSVQTTCTSKLSNRKPSKTIFSRTGSILNLKWHFKMFLFKITIGLKLNHNTINTEHEYHSNNMLFYLWLQRTQTTRKWDFVRFIRRRILRDEWHYKYTYHSPIVIILESVPLE